ncbi:hypothetical protein [Streptomyces sp. NPDC003996]
MVGDPRVPQHLAQDLRALGERVDGGLVRVQDLVALGRLGGDLLLPLARRRGRDIAEHIVRVERITPTARREPGLHILHRDTELRRPRPRRRTRETTGGKEDPRVVGARVVARTAVHPREGLVLGERPIPLLLGGPGRVRVLAVERGADVVNGLQGRLVGLRSVVLVEVAVVLPEPVGDPLAQTGLVVETLLTVRRPVEPGVGEPTGRRQTVQGLLPPLAQSVQSVHLLARRIPVLLIRDGQRRLLPVLPVGQDMQFVGVLVQAVLRGRGHRRTAEAQHVGHQALVLPQLLGGRVLVPGIGITRRLGMQRGRARLHRESGHDRQCGHSGDGGGEPC